MRAPDHRNVRYILQLVKGVPRAREAGEELNPFAELMGALQGQSCHKRLVVHVREQRGDGALLREYLDGLEHKPACSIPNHGQDPRIFDFGQKYAKI